MVKRPTPIYNEAKLVLFAQRFDHHLTMAWPGLLTITFLILFELSQESTIALVILHTARTVGTGFALFARPLTSCVFVIYIYIYIYIYI